MSSVAEIQIVTVLTFHVENTRKDTGCWYVCTRSTVEASACKHSNDKYVASGNGAALDVKIAIGSKRKPGLGSYIMLFNENENLVIAFDLVI